VAGRTAFAAVGAPLSGRLRPQPLARTVRARYRTRSVQGSGQG
jgi:hypothetical protein